MSSPLSSNNNSQNFSQFYSENYQWLYSWLCKTVRSNHHIEDILQDTFLKVLINPDLIENIKQPRPYLATTAKNIMINHARRKKIEDEYLKYIKEQYDEELEHSPEELYIVFEALHLVVNALNQLPDRQRQVMILHYIEGISQVDIAKLFQVSRKTVQLDLMKAIAHCHRQIQQQM